VTNADRWDRIGRLFDRALELDAADRAVLLDEVRAEDVALADEVESLLAEHEADGFIADTPTAAPEPRLYGLESDHVGPYRIIRPIGRGGMGIVYLAERTTEDVTQTVALKLLRADFAATSLLDRFRAERRILARLEHPGIARLIDTGATPSGQPYYAMEFIDGADLMTWMRQTKPTVRQRIELFLDVCDAVGYAHHQLVVHRDLKPGNILVPEDGRPRLLDFGIAKLVDPMEQPEGEARTVRWCTPDYASPEQVRGHAVTTESDVYALGALLYELLAGIRPFNLEGLSPARIEQVVAGDMPRRPSDRAGDASLRRALEGDLDTIVLKALAKEPWRRYPSADALADDLRRYLDRKPVRARPDTWSYRAIRFIQRNRVAVAAACLLLLSLAAGLAASSWQATRARRERDRAEAALRRSEDVTALLIGLFEAARPGAASADTATSRAILQQGVTRIGELEGQPEVQAQMLDALGLVLMSLDRFDEARDMLGRGLALRRRTFGEESAEAAESLTHLARTFRALSEFAQADSLVRRALAIQRQRLGNDDPVVASTLLDLASLQPYLGRNDLARGHVMEALAIRERAFGPDHVDVGRAMVRVAAFARLRGDYDDALEYGRRGVEVVRRHLGDADPEVGANAYVLADIERDAGNLEEAERLFREGIAIQSAAYGGDHIQMIHGLSNLATLLTGQGRHEEAELLYRRALAIRERTIGPESGAAAAAHDELSVSLAAQGRLAEAEAERRRGLDLWRKAVGPEHASIAGSLAGLGLLVAERGRLEEAESLLREAIAMRSRLYGPDHALVAIAETELGSVLTRARRFADAERVLLDAQRVLDEQVDANPVDQAAVRDALRDLYEAWGRPQDAARYR
jgi:serine/threonine-protein kinase